MGQGDSLVTTNKAEAERRLFEGLVRRLSEGGWIKKRGVQRTDSTHVLAVRRLNRVELLGEMLRTVSIRWLNTIPIG